ncbi:MAG: recombinase family protein [Acidobacteria bacterium]|nr:MAG: recombinase family protein [Acidobacteriota bacterium]MCE7957224.1 recombinase family protein [Acidobacteria bacterium ACB2]
MKTPRSRPGSPPVEVKRCAVYTRKSTSAGLEQEFNSLDAQREACVAYVQRQPGWALLDQQYDDGGFTGANIERPAFQRLLTDVEAGKVDVVVVYKVDRLSRSLLDFARVMERFGAAGASFVSVTQNFSTADAMGRLTLNMLMSFAEFEREMIGERTRDKIAAARRKGKWTGGPVPLGYRVEEKHLVVVELEAVVVREVFALYQEHRSTLEVTRLLNERHRSTKRHRSEKGNLRESRTFTKADVTRILRNPVYAGYMASNGDLYEAEHPPIVDRETFARVGALLDGATRRTQANGRNPDYILRGLLRCACCGSAFTPASTRKGKTEYRYYRCVKRDKEGKNACPSAPLPAAAIEDFVVEQLRQAVQGSELAGEVADSVRKRVEGRRRDLRTERQKLPAEIARLSAEGKLLVETLAEAKGSARRLVEERLRDLGESLEKCEARLATAERELSNLDAIEVETSWVKTCLDDFGAVWDVLTPPNRGRLLRAVIQSVEVDEPANQVKVVITDLGT